MTDGVQASVASFGTQSTLPSRGLPTIRLPTLTVIAAPAVLGYGDSPTSSGTGSPRLSFSYWRASMVDATRA